MNVRRRFGLGAWSIIGAAVLAVTALFLWRSGMGTNEVAALIQAVGSIGAIVFASMHASSQAAAAERLVEGERLAARYDKLDSIFAIAYAAREHVDTVADGLAEAPDGAKFNGITEFFDVRVLQVAGNALAQIPLHELGSNNMVRALIELQLAVRSAEHALVLACTEEDGRRDPEEFIDAANEMRKSASGAMETIKRALSEAKSDMGTHRSIH